MKKKLNVDGVMNELKGESVFFPAQSAPPETPQPPIRTEPTLKTVETTSPASASVQASTQASQHDSLLAEIRRTIKVQGKEVSYVRLTQEEKNQLADIIYSYKRQGVKTTETEISRIAINYLIEEYRANGQASILARLLVLLNA